METANTYLVYVIVLTALLWIPYIINRTMVLGLKDAMGYPANPKPMAPWAERAKKAHYNAVENLVLFAPLVLVAGAAGVSNQTTAMAALVYFLARLVHYIVYAFAIPWLRTISWTVGWVCTLVVAWQILIR